MAADTETAEPTVVAAGEKQFHGWLLLAVLALVILATAIVCAVVDRMVLPR